MKKFLLLILVVFAAQQSFSQQLPQYSQYSLNNFLLNPAVTGVEDFVDLRFGYRRQWSGLEGAPTSYYVSGHTAIGKSDRNVNTNGYSKGRPKVNKNNRFHRARPHHGVGSIVQVDETGPLKSVGAHVTYAYHQPISKKIKVSLGASGGFLQNSLNPEYLEMSNPNDPAAQDGRLNETKPDIGLGTWIYSPDFYIGFAAAQLLRNESDFAAPSTLTSPGRFQKHFFATAGYRLEVAPQWTIMPSVMMKFAKPSPVIADVNFKAMYAERIWGGVSYRHKDAVSVVTGFYLSPLLNVGYSYDITTSNLRLASAGSHEIVIGLKLNNQAKIICPQWIW